MLEASSSRSFTGEKEACSSPNLHPNSPQSHFSTQTQIVLSYPIQTSRSPDPSTSHGSPNTICDTSHPSPGPPWYQDPVHRAYPSSCLDIHPPLLSESSFRIARQTNLRTLFTPQLTLNLIRASRHSRLRWPHSSVKTHSEPVSRNDTTPHHTTKGAFGLSSGNSLFPAPRRPASNKQPAQARASLTISPCPARPKQHSSSKESGESLISIH